ncbi:hypothetical protein C8Q72DRAFT_567546 [Fomitopsis betulina]|nr:hypothetical protein C8Q72DRAFT_567546 [Fomitopsis betulina]
MSSTISTEQLNISLEPHLTEALHPLLHILPEDLRSHLQDLILRERPHSPTIPYSLLASISAWARTPAGKRALDSHDPPLLPGGYSMIALLAGTQTSPERKFPAYVARSDDADGRFSYSDRRAVTIVLNALLSIGGAGAATWWAAGRLAWKDQWKVLLSLAVALVVAASEAILYLIWESRRSERPQRRRRPARLAATNPKKDDADAPQHDPDTIAPRELSSSTAVSDVQSSGTLRERTTSSKEP